MAIDPTISLRGQTPDFVGAVNRGIESAQKSQQNAQQTQLNQAKLDMVPLERRTKELETAKAQIDMVGSLLGSAVDQASYDAAKQKAMQLGLDVSREPPVFDPNHIRQSQMALLGVKDKIELELKQALNEARIATEGQRAGSYGALANQRNAAAGSFGALANARNADAQMTLNPPEPAAGPVAPNPSAQVGLLPPPAVEGGNPAPLAPNPAAKVLGKAPSGFRWKQDGSLEPIPGGPKDPSMVAKKPPTEGQSNAALYATRMEESNKIISDLSKKGYSPTVGQDVVAEAPLGNFVLGEDTQKFQQAQRDFINAVLRRESGAVISDQEFDNARKQYFPQPGDSKVVLEQKEKNRQTAIQGIKNAAGPAIKEVKQDYSKMSDDEIRKSLGL